MDNEFIQEVDHNFSKLEKVPVPAFMDFEKKEEKQVEVSSGDTNEISTDDEMRKELKNDNKQDHDLAKSQAA